MPSSFNELLITCESILIYVSSRRRVYSDVKNAGGVIIKGLWENELTSRTFDEKILSSIPPIWPLEMF